MPSQRAAKRSTFLSESQKDTHLLSSVLKPKTIPASGLLTRVVVVVRPSRVATFRELSDKLPPDSCRSYTTLEPDPDCAFSCLPTVGHWKLFTKLVLGKIRALINRALPMPDRMQRGTPVSLNLMTTNLNLTITTQRPTGPIGHSLGGIRPGGGDGNVWGRRSFPWR